MTQQKGVSSFLNNDFDTLIYVQTPERQLWQRRSGDKNPQLVAENILDKDEVLVYFAQYKDEVIIQTNQALYEVVDRKLQRLATEVVHFALSSDGEAVVWHNGHEVWLLWLKNNPQQPYQTAGQRDLLSRTTNLMRNIYWLDGDHWLVAEELNGARLLETDLRGGANYPKLTNLDQRDQLWYGLKENIIYFLHAGTLGSWKLK